ncbi:MAG: type II toxin-antitoxin system HicB family antitoxin [Armatimonadetes bacterium]|nr:type II toxin-antitoxin system HicB family antitoxin [Anaerolineae bacterium]
MNNNPQHDLAYYLTLPYTIEVIADEDGGWFVHIPLLEGCMSQGDTWEEVLEMINDAKEGWLWVALKYGHIIPEPSVIEMQALQVE